MGRSMLDRFRPWVRGAALRSRTGRAAYHRLGTWYHQARLRRDAAIRPPPILVHQMGKVGSRTVAQTIARALPDRPLYHVHALNEATLATYRRSAEKRRRAGQIDVDAPTLTGHYLRRRVSAHPDFPWSVVTTIREPVARNISTLFQNAYRWIPDFEARCLRGEDLQQPLEQAFWNHSFHDQPARWFEDETKAIFGIDVLARPFDLEKGFQIYTQGATRLLLLRLENIGALPQALDAWLHLGHQPTTVSTNESKNKYYRKAYQDFVRRFEIPEHYLDEQYGTPFAEHFYSDEERKDFRKQWAG